MYNETFNEPHKQGLVKLTGGNKTLYYCNEQISESEEGNQYTYDVYEFVGSVTSDHIKSTIIASEFPVEEEVKILRKTLANVLSGGKITDEFDRYNKRVSEITRMVDDLGKTIQTQAGSGSVEDPYKDWKVGKTVEAGKWYLTEDGYLWEAIKSGKPSSTTDKEFFDVVGL